MIYCRKTSTEVTQMSSSFDRMQKRLGFGFMRLPMIGEDVDIPQTSRMVDIFLESGFNYFDTAHGYINGKSELAIKECLSSRYPRDRYVLTNKLSIHYFNRQEDIRPLFQQQLDACGVEYFDFYLMHAMSAARLSHFEETKAFETVLQIHDHREGGRREHGQKHTPVHQQHQRGDGADDQGQDVPLMVLPVHD